MLVLESDNRTFFTKILSLGEKLNAQTKNGNSALILELKKNAYGNVCWFLEKKRKEKIKQNENARIIASKLN